MEISRDLRPSRQRLANVVSAQASSRMSVSGAVPAGARRLDSCVFAHVGQQLVECSTNWHHIYHHHAAEALREQTRCLPQPVERRGSFVLSFLLSLLGCLNYYINPCQSTGPPRRLTRPRRWIIPSGSQVADDMIGVQVDPDFARRRADQVNRLFDSEACCNQRQYTGCSLTSWSRS